MTRSGRYPTELRERAIRLVREHRAEHPSEWAAIQAIANKLGITPETLRIWLRRDTWIIGSARASLAMSGSGCTTWSARTASCGEPTRS